MRLTSNLPKRFLPVCLAALALAASTDGAQATKGFKTSYNFCQQAKCADGSQPEAALIYDGKGHLYGTTYQGGIYNYGTVFEASGGGETVLWSFDKGVGDDGAYPESSLIMDKSGNLYGTTKQGGTGYGTIFEILAGGGTEYILWTFCYLTNCADGADPEAGVIADSKGNLYGTAVEGGANDGGTVFSLDPSTEVLTALYSFCGQKNCTDGKYPQANLLRDAKGNLYGTTSTGGAGANCSPANSCGTVFKLAPPAKGHTAWTETVLYSFCAQKGCSDGANSYAPLIEDADGNLYGTTFGGGDAVCNGSGCGTVFELTPKGAEKVRYTFCEEGDCYYGGQPLAGLLLDSGTFYGTTQGGGPNSKGSNGGTVFSLSSSGKEKVVHGFAGGDGSSPRAGVILAQGLLFGTTPAGGADQSGTIFQVGVSGAAAQRNENGAGTTKRTP